MTEDRLQPDEELVQTIREEWEDKNDTPSKVYQTILGCREYAHADEIADIAGCSTKAAKKYLERLEKMGIVERGYGYRRNEGYMEWMEANEIANDLSEDEIIERVCKLESRSDELGDEFGSEGPDRVSVFDSESSEAIHQQMQYISEWRKIERDIQIYELARQLNQNDGHLIPGHE